MLVQLSWLLAVVNVAVWKNIFAADPAIVFLAQAARLAERLAAGQVPAAGLGEVRAQIFNLRLDAGVTALFMSLVALIVVESVRVWYRELRGPAPAGALGVVTEA